jgi:mono/diheme cytochrome c family protein
MFSCMMAYAGGRVRLPHRLNFKRIWVLLASFLLVSCTAHKKPSQVETDLANMAKDIVIPIETDELINPLTRSPQVINQGQQIYQQSCALCHGVDGHGQTNLGQGMYPPAMDLTSPHVQHWNDAQMYWIIENGVRLTGMPSWKEVLSPEDSWKLVVYVHALPDLNAAPSTKAKAQPFQAKSPMQKIAYGRTLYRQEGCFMCHKLGGEGTAVGPDLSREGTRGRTPEWLVGHFRNPSAYVPGSIMPPFGNLTDEQLSALTEFLEDQNGEGTKPK